MAKPNEYRIAEDGLEARVVGPWVSRKTHFVDRYVEMFATGMKNKWGRRAYVELFSGPGRSYDRAARTFLDGSARRSMDADLTDYVFVDLDPTATTALQQRLDPTTKGRPMTILTADCNAAIGSVVDHVPAEALTLAFIDPTNWQVRLATVLHLAKDRRVDLLMTFHIGGMKRVAGLHVPRLDEFFGSHEWAESLSLPREQQTVGLLKLYNRQLENVGYLPECWKESVPVRNRRNSLIYSLVLFTKSERGLDFWRKAREVEETGQLPLFH